MVPGVQTQPPILSERLRDKPAGGTRRRRRSGVGRWSEGWKEEVEKGGQGVGVRKEAVEECRIAHGLLPPEREGGRQTDR